MSDLILRADMALVVPVADGKQIVFDMREVLRAEGRLIELCNVTKVNAGELTYTFILARDKASKYAGQLEAELARAKSRLNKVRAVVVLDRVPDELKNRGLASSRSPAGSEDLRSAVVARDPDFQEAEELVIQIMAALAHMKTKVETFKMAYFSVDREGGQTRRETSGGTGTDDIGTPTDQEKLEAFVNEHSTVHPKSYENTGFGTPKI